MPTAQLTLSADTENVMRLLTHVILADGHIFGSEIEAFVKGVGDLALKDTSDIVLSKAAIRSWFESYLADIDAQTSLDSEDVAVTRLILSLSAWPDKQAVLDTLEAISVADAEFHMEEKLLISIVKAYWQI